MKNISILIFSLLICIFFIQCQEDTNYPSEGSFTVLTYNVAGLPEGISSSDPVSNIPQISPMLNNYDIVLVQEDFFYHDELKEDALHEYQTVPDTEADSLGDGLNIFSIFPIGELYREQWDECNGYLDGASDCLTPKGFCSLPIYITPEIVIDFYDLHMEAGGQPEDEAVRSGNVTQLLSRINEFSVNSALIVAGDFNLHDDEIDAAEVERILTGANLTDSCRYLDCGEPARIDRIMYRNGASFKLESLSWEVATEFVDSQGNDLSDHDAVATLISWQKI